MLDDFFSDNLLSSRSLVRDTFKIYIEETSSEYRIEGEFPGVKKEEIDLGIENDSFCITVSKETQTVSSCKIE